MHQIGNNAGNSGFLASNKIHQTFSLLYAEVAAAAPQ